MSLRMREPDWEIQWQFGIAPNPFYWVWLPVIDRKVPPGLRGYWSVTWLFIHVARGWRYV